MQPSRKPQVLRQGAVLAQEVAEFSGVDSAAEEKVLDLHRVVPYGACGDEEGQTLSACVCVCVSAKVSEALSLALVRCAFTYGWPDPRSAPTWGGASGKWPLARRDRIAATAA